MQVDSYPNQHERRQMFLLGLHLREESGKEEGLKEGIKIGRGQGRKEGKKEERVETAIKMQKKEFSIEEIHEITELPIEKIKLLQKSLESET